MAQHSTSSQPPGATNEGQLIGSLQRTGLSVSGIRQALQGNIVSDPSDRATIARILASVAALPNAQLEHYDFPGAYAGRFDGIDTGKPGNPPRLTPKKC
ncbi:MAG: hypothetical protein ACRENP_20440 [Longimicrobiales bacterium]